MYISGVPGTGKSSLIQRMALADIRAGRGVCVIDPTRDLVNRLVHWIPAGRVRDTIYFDVDDPIQIDFFSYRNPSERRVLTDQLLNLFSLETAPVARPRLQRIIGTLFDANEAGGQFNFLDIQHFIERPKTQEQVFKFAPHRREQWTSIKPADYSPIIERMTPFTESPNLRRMFSGKGLNLWDVMQGKKVLLVNLRDTPTDVFIGSLIVAKIQQAIFGRDTIPESQRIPFYLYIDECQTVMRFCAPEFEAILTRARKYKLCLVIANQIVEDLPKEIQKKLPTIHTRVAFTEPFRAFLTQGNGLPDYIKTPQPLKGSPASYAAIITKRTVHNSPSNSGPNPHNEENGTGNTTKKAIDYDTIEGEPLDEGKAQRDRGPR